MVMWKELAIRLKKGEVIDQKEMSLLEAMKNRWRDILKRLVCIIQSLAERNLALRGTTEILHHPNSGNFLKEVELLAKFDPVLKNHISRIDCGEKIHILAKEFKMNLFPVLAIKLLM